MTEALANHNRPQLREDLTSIQVDGGVRPYRIVIDEIGGRFSRVSERVWQRLEHGIGGDAVWVEASAAGWLRDRTRSPGRSPGLPAVRFCRESPR